MPRAARTAVTVVFFASGAAYGSFVARIPAIKDRLDASEGELGLALFGIAAGAIVALPLAGWLTARLGSRRVTRAALAAVAFALPLPALVSSLPALGLVLAVFGAAGATLDLSMNAHGVAVESHYRRPILSSFHAAFSLGGLIGAASGGLAAAGGVSPLAQFAGAGVAIAAICVWSARGLLPRTVDAVAAGPVFGRPTRSLAALAAIAFACLFAEGAAADWGAIYLDDSIGTGEAAATSAFVAFSVLMTAGRIVGDRLTAAWGTVALARRAGALGAAGLAAALVSGNAVVAVAGFACLGAGLAPTIPTVFRAAGERTVVPGAGIAAVSTVGYAAFLVGPPTIGFVAEATSLPDALWLVVALVALVAVLAGSTRPG